MWRCGSLAGIGLAFAACTFDTTGLQPRPGDGAPADVAAETGGDGAPRAERRDGAPSPDGAREAATDQHRADLPPPCAANPSLCQGQTPICDVFCRACAAHSECPAGLCRADGSCPAAAEISVVDDSCGSVQEGTSANPYCKINDAVGKPPPYILVRAGTYSGDTIVNTSKEVYAEPGAVLAPSACDKVVLDGKITALLSGFAITGNVAVKGSAKGTLLRNEIGPSACTGVNGAGAGELVLERNLIVGHSGGGVLLDGSYRVRNNLIVKNGSAALTWGGVKIAATTKTSLFVNNTLVGNLSKGGNDKEAGGVRCEAAAATATFVNTIFWGNTFNTTAAKNGDRQYGPVCQASFSLEELKAGATPAATNLSQDPQLATTGLDTAAPYYRLQGGSPARDKGTPTDAPPVDYDGEPRDAKPDIGADEIFP